MSTGDVTDRSSVADWTTISGNAAKAQNLSQVKEVSVALRRFLQENESNLTIGQLEGIHKVCQDLKKRASDKKVASFIQRILRTRKSVEKEISVLEKRIKTLEHEKFRQISDQIDEKIKQGDFKGAAQHLEESNKYLNSIEKEYFSNKIKKQEELSQASNTKQVALNPEVTVATLAILQSASQKRDLVCQKANLNPSEHARYQEFAEKHRSEWAKLGPNDAPISYPRSQTGLSRSVTFVPGKGLMIHMKGGRRWLERQQLGQRGAQGVVTKAVNFHTGAVDAFKSMDVTQFTQVQREISDETLQLHAQLKDHPEMFASGRTVHYRDTKGKEKVGLFMPIMKGGELLDKAQKGLDKKQQASYSIQMAKSIRFLHSQGYLHRDLKLENFLLSEDGATVVLADFDMAVKCDSDKVYRGDGNLGRMAPETYGTWLFKQFERVGVPEFSYNQFLQTWGHICSIDHYFNMLGDGVSKDQPLVPLFRERFGDSMAKESEVFSFGVLLYDMKFGNNTYKYPDSLNILNSQDPYDQIILSCLQLDPQDRPNMDSVIQQLEHVQGSLSE